MDHYILFQIVVIALAGLGAQWIAWYLKIPAIVFLLSFGFILGPISGILQPDEMLGDFLKPAVSAAVAIILFDGALQLRFGELNKAGAGVNRVIGIGAPVSWVLIWLAGHYIAGLSVPVAMTLSGILIVTGPTVIMPMLRNARLQQRVGSVLKWEGIVNDPLGVIVAILCYEYFLRTGTSDGGMQIEFTTYVAIILVFIVLVSFALAHIVNFLFDKRAVPEFLKAPFLLTIILGLFYFCGVLLEESGLIAVTVLGMTMANIRVASIEEIRRFKETITILLLSGIFLILTANVDVSVVASMGWRDFAFIFLVIFIIRPVVMALGLIRSGLSWQEKLLIGWIAPRGIVCAALAGILGPLLIDAGYDDGGKILPLAFSIVVLTVFIHGLTIKPISDYLGLSAGKKDGLIIVGAYKWTIQLASVLHECGVPVLIVDSNWTRLKGARLENVPTYYGEILSEVREYQLDINKYDTLLAATRNAAYNSLICDTFAREFSRERVFQLSIGDDDAPESKRFSNAVRGRTWVAHYLTADEMFRRYNENWRFRATRIGKDPETGKMYAPEKVEDMTPIGVLQKNGFFLFSHPELRILNQVKKEDIAILFSKDKKVEKAEKTLQAQKQSS